MSHPIALMIVEDDARLRAALREGLLTHFETVEACGSVEGARRLFASFTPQAILLDVALPDGNALDVVTLAERLSPSPLIVAMSGAALPQESFELARRGVRAFIAKPVGVADVLQAFDHAEEEPPDIAPFVKALVGRHPIREVETEVRSTMLGEALARSRGSRRGAARLLSVSRQLIQHMVKRISAP